MKLKIKESVLDGFKVVKNNPVILFVGLIYAIIIKLLEPKNLAQLLDGELSYNLYDFVYSYGGLNLIAIISVSIFINGVIIVMAAKGKKFSTMSAVKLVASKYIILLLSSILVFAVTSLGLIALILPGIFLFIKLLYFEQAILLNNKGVVESLKMSWNVTRENWLGIFTLVILISLLSLVIVVPIDFFSRYIADLIGGILIVPLVATIYTKSYLQLKK